MNSTIRVFRLLVRTVLATTLCVCRVRPTREKTDHRNDGESIFFFALPLGVKGECRLKPTTGLATRAGPLL